MDRITRQKLIRRKAAMRGKLMAAVAMLLVATIMMTSTTFAWFALSTAPEVRGVQTTLASNGNLEIALNHNALDAAYFSAETTDGGVDDVVLRNGYWGNLLELDQTDYGLQTVSLKPVTPNYTDGSAANIESSAPFSFVRYGFDGRGIGLSSNGQLKRFDPSLNRFDVDENYGVRAYCEEYKAPDPSLPSAYDPCAFGIDMLFRTNAEDANLLLQTLGIDRVYNEGNAPDNWYDAYEFELRQGSGSRVTIDNEEVRDAIRVAFTNTLTGEVYGIAAPGEDGYLRLESGDDVLVPLQKDTVIGITAWIYLSGYDIDNNGVDSVEATDLTVNLQFSTDVALRPMMETLRVTEGIQYRLNSDGLSYSVSGVSSYNYGNTDLVIPANFEGKPVTAIADSAFNGNTSLRGITIPDTVKSIGEYAFFGCSALSSISIPAGVESIGVGAFSNCRSLVTIQVAEGNPYYSNDAYGVLFDKNKTTLISCPGTLAGSYTVPNGVTALADGAFKGCASLTGVGLPATLTQISNYAFDNCAGLRSLDIPGSVTTIGKYAFRECDGVSSIVIPNSVTAVGEGLFYGCGGLTEVTLSNQLGAIGGSVFFGCYHLEEITVPDSVTEIGVYAFQNCTGLTRVVIGSGTRSIGSTAFLGCPKLTGFVVDSSNSWYCNDDSGVLYNKNKTTLLRCPGALEGSYAIPDGVTKINNYGFHGCSKLTEITIPASVTDIGEYAFGSCSNLTEITIPDGVTSIKIATFNECSKLAAVTIPDSVTKIENHAFCGCISLTEVSIPDGVTEIGESAFSSCRSLTSFTIPNGVTSIKGSTFHGCWGLTAVTIPDSVTEIGTYAFYNCTRLSSVTIPNSVTSVSSRSFMNCTALTSIVIPNSVTTTGESAFRDCSALTSVTLSSGVSYISPNMFQNCTSLTSITIPSGVTNIQSDAFSGCTSLASVTIPSGATYIQTDAFAGCTSLTGVTIPEGTVYLREAFSGCTSLTNVSIPVSVTQFDSGAFKGCNTLTTVTYAGTKAQWKNLAPSGLSNMTANYTVHCTDGTIARDGTETDL